MARYKPDYERIADDIRELIKSGKLRPGDKLPTKRQLAEQYGTSAQPVDSAMFVLRGEGLIQGRQGKGIYVRDPDEDRRGGS